MGSVIGSKQNVKIFVLYLMENVGRPLDFVTLNDIVMQTDYVMYLDFAESFYKMYSKRNSQLCTSSDQAGNYGGLCL